MLNACVPASATGLPFNPSASFASQIVGRGRHHALIEPYRLVVFRRDLSDLSRITAVFPCEPSDDGQLVGFTREEGTMPCSRLWFDMSQRAQEEHYAPLAAYLRAKGNKLDIRHRITPAMDRTREWRIAEKARQEQAAQEMLSACEPLREPLDLVAGVSGVSLEVLASRGRLEAPSARAARQAVILLARRQFGLAVTTIASAYGVAEKTAENRIYAVSGRRKSDPVLADLLSKAEAVAGPARPVARKRWGKAYQLSVAQETAAAF